MKAILLGSGGVIPAPRPGSDSLPSRLAKEKGIPDYRTGPSFYVEDAKLLFDCPEEIRQQILREDIREIKNVIITHWHPDHTLGIRILEQYNWDFENGRPVRDPVNVFISKYQFDMFKKLSCGGFLDFYEKRGIIKIKFFESQDVIDFGSVSVKPIIIENTKGFYFVISDKKGKKMVYAPCEYHGFEVDHDVNNVDVFVVHNLFWEDKTISPRKIPPKDEDSFEHMLAHAKKMNTKKIIITHIEETFLLSHDELNKVLGEKFGGFNIEAGYDGMRIKL